MCFCSLNNSGENSSCLLASVFGTGIQWDESKTPLLLDSFLMAAVTNYHKPSDEKQPEFITLPFQRSEVSQSGVSRTELLLEALASFGSWPLHPSSDSDIPAFLL